jgi:DNA-binding transcriptional regulator YiaG
VFFDKRFLESLHSISIETLRNWKQGERSPDLTGIAYLTCIAKNPEVISSLLNN